MNGHDTRDYRVAAESLLFQYNGQHFSLMLLLFS